VRIEPESYVPVEVAEDVPGLPGFVPPVPVFPLFLDLPLLTGQEVPHAPHLAVTAKPWPGSAALYSASEDAGYAFDTLVTRPAAIGVLEVPLASASPGLIDRAGRLRVKLTSGTLASISNLGLLNGKNLAAIGDGSPENWELVQFRDAALVAEDSYELSHLLRGQLGSDAWQPETWPEGSYFVLMDAAAQQIDLPLSARTLPRNYRIGPAARAYDDPSYTHIEAAFSGVGLKPLSPCHLRVAQDAGGEISASWIRRSRINADAWEGIDVPLGEEAEQYLLRVRSGGTVLREELLTSPAWSYSVSQAQSDGAGAQISVEVAQVSAIYGAGACAETEMTL